MIILLKNNLIKQMRSYSFFVVLILSLFLGYACVPSQSSGYQIFYIGGIRGIYNSAWLGAMAVLLSLLLLWLFGFYMLRSEISQEEKLKVGQIVASTPISKLKYIFIKTISNFCVLLCIHLIIIAAFIVMQLYRGESYYINLWNYIAPFIFISIPSLLLLSSITIFFDVVSILKGTIGNMLYFCLWMMFSVLSLENSESYFDIYGLNVICSDMVKAAKNKYTELANTDIGASFGYYTNSHVSVFEWNGINYNFDLFKERFIWIIAAVIIILLSSLFFNRFKKVKKGSEKSILAFGTFQHTEKVENIKNQSFKLSPIKKTKKIRIFSLVFFELKIMLKGLSIWWYILAIFTIAASPFIPLRTSKEWMPLVLLIPIGIWSKIQTQDKYSFTREVISSSCDPLYKMISSWIAGILLGLIVSMGALYNFISSGDTAAALPWIAGVIFISTLALFCGELTGTRKMFEIIYMIWWYFGPMNGMPYCDFLGTTSNNSVLYMSIAIILFIVSIFNKKINFKLGR